MKNIFPLILLFLPTYAMAWTLSGRDLAGGTPYTVKSEDQKKGLIIIRFHHAATEEEKNLLTGIYKKWRDYRIVGLGIESPQNTYFIQEYIDIGLPFPVIYNKIKATENNAHKHLSWFIYAPDNQLVQQSEKIDVLRTFAPTEEIK